MPPRACVCVCVCACVCGQQAIILTTRPAVKLNMQASRAATTYTPPPLGTQSARSSAEGGQARGCSHTHTRVSAASARVISWLPSRRALHPKHVQVQGRARNESTRVPCGGRKKIVIVFFYRGESRRGIKGIIILIIISNYIFVLLLGRTRGGRRSLHDAAS